MNPKEIIEYIDSKLKSNVVPLDVERDAIQLIEEYAQSYHEAKVKNLSSNTVLCSSLPSIEKIIKSRIADAFDNGMQNFEKKELLNALDAIKRLIPPSYFEGNGA